MMTRLLAVTILLAVAGCKKSPEQAPDPVPTKMTVSGVEMIEFESPEAKFSCLAPGEWGLEQPRYLDPKLGSAFVAPYRSISIHKYPEFENGQYKTAEQYAESFWMLGKQPEIKKEKLGGATVLRFHQERASTRHHSNKPGPVYRFDYALFPVPGGFYEVQHRALADKYQESLPVFEAVVRSFKPL